MNNTNNSYWRLIGTAPKNGTVIDVWCKSEENDEGQIRYGRLTDVFWHHSDKLFNHTGWVRITDDGGWDLVDSGPTCEFGLPRWIPIYWMPVQ